MHRRETVEIFRNRLVEVIEQSGMSRSEFARRIGADRSTLSQLLAADGTRLPRAETIAAIAMVAQVSVDWLLGLSAEGQMGTEQAIRYEYLQHDTLAPEGRIEQAEARLAYSRRPETDIEVCSSYQSVAQFARGQGEWEDLDIDIRTGQLESMIGLLDELYPTLRWFLYDLRQCYSVPFTVFGPMRVAIYVGDMWLVSTSQEHVRVFTGHFDNLIRAAVMQPPEVIAYLRRLLAEISDGDRSVSMGA